ncbi:MAG: hypothetical protein MJ195_01505 [Mycoplasmoidaceae bacterium]|nr:hypothetical protein [Mycoplasmoidaceae bacterium]
MPRDGKGEVGPFAVYDTGYEQTKEPEHLDLFRTYAKQLTDDPQHLVDNNYNHRRT